MVFPLLVAMFLIGCNNEEKTIEVNNASSSDVEEVTTIIENNNEIYSGRAIFVEDQMLVAVQAKPWLDYKKTKIEKKLKEQLEEKFPNYEITVSADYKLYWESQKLLKEEDTEKVMDKVEKLKKLSKEET